MNQTHKIFDSSITSPSHQALDQQIGGAHYKKLAIQPVEYITKNHIGFCEGSAIKYLTRWRDKGGIQDLKKARHFIDLLIQMETTCPHCGGEDCTTAEWRAAHPKARACCPDCIHGNPEHGAHDGLPKRKAGEA